MRRVPLSVIILLMALGCSFDRGDDRRMRWREVQELRKAYETSRSPDRLAAKQRWADAVRQFLVDWPDHPGATRTWNHLQLDYAEQLEANGHFTEAEKHYRNLLDREPGQLRAAEGLRRVSFRQSLTRGDFQELEKGMTTQEVARLLGLPRPGWDRHGIVDGQPVESWYYRGVDGQTRGIHFRDGRLFEVDLD